MSQPDNLNKRKFYHAINQICVFILVYLFSQVVYGQPCTLTVDAGKDVEICSSSTTQLKAVQTGGVEANVTYVWTPATGLDSPNAANTNAHPIITTSYTVTATEISTEGTCIKTDDLVVTINPLPVVDFSFNNDNACSGTTVQFTAFATGKDPFSYTWNFGDGITSTEQNPSHEFTSLGCGTALFVVTFTVTDAAGCSKSITHSISVMQKPDIDFQDVDHPFDPFSNCSNASASNPVYPITIGNVSTSACISSYSINWGDGTSTSNVSFPISHSYSLLGAYDMVITAFGNNGCSSSKTYIIKNVSNPSGGIISPGSTTNLCAPTSDLQFEISKWGANSPGTIYEINYGDNTPIVKLTQNQLESSTYYNAINPIASLNYPIPHSYTKSNCPESQFTVTLTVTNACGSTPFTAGNISVLNKSVADFTGSKSACVNTSVLFTNNTISGYSQNCSQNSIYKWDFGDGTPVITTQPASPQNVSHIYSNLGNYTVTLTALNFCGSTSKPQQICIESPLLPQFTLNNITGCTPLAVTANNTTDVSNACSPPTYSWGVTYTSRNCGTSSAYSFTGGTNSSSKDPSLLFTNPGTYTIKLAVTNSCGTVVSNEQTVIVKQPPTVSINAIPSVCQILPTTAISPTATVADCGSVPLAYEWSFPGGSPATSASVNPGPVSFSSPGTHTVSLKVTNECGTSIAISNTFTIKPIPNVDNITSQLKCKGEQSDAIVFAGTVASTVFSWTNNNSNIGLAPSGAGNINSFLLTNAGNSVLTSTITVTPSLNGCTGPSKSFTIAVNPTAQVNQPANLVVCAGVATLPVTFTTNNSGGTTTFSWTNNTPGIGLDASGTGNISSFVAVNLGITPIIAPIIVTPTFSNGGVSCPGTTKSFTITINPTPGLLVLPDKEFCNGVRTNQITFNNQVAGTTYSWTNSNILIGLPGVGSGDLPAFTPVNNGSSPISATITVTPNANGCPGAAQTFTITINPSPVITFSAGNQTICTGDNSALVTLNSATTGVEYKWTALKPAGLEGVATIGTNTIPVQALVNSTDSPIIVTYKATAALTGAAPCSGAEFIYTITVKPRPFVSANITRTICSGSTFTVIPSNGSGNTIPTGTTYIWSTPTISPAGALPGAIAQNSAQTIISQLLTNTTHAVATATYTVTPVSAGCVGQPFDVIVTVNPILTVDTRSNITLNNGEQNVQIDFTGAVTGTIYKWISSSTSIGIASSGSDMIAAFTAVNTGTTPKITTITVTPSANLCDGTPITFTITVNPTPIVNPVADKILCNNDISNGINFAGAISGTTFTWTNDTPAIGLAASGNGNIPGFTAVNAGITPTVAKITVTPSTNGFQGIIQTFTITVNPTPTVNDISNQVKCNGQSSVAVDFTGAAAGTLYNWTNSEPGIGIVASGPGNIDPIILTNKGISVLTSTITVIPSFNGCPGPSKSFTIAVNPTAQVNKPADQVICNGGSTSPILFTTNNTGGITTFSWTNDSPGIGLAVNGTGDIDSFTTENSTNSPLTATISVTPTFNNGEISCSGPAQTFTVTVNPTSQVNIPAAQVICNGKTALVNFSTMNTGGITSYSWTNNTTSIGLAATGRGNISSFKTVNTTNSPVTASISVTPIFFNGGVSCPGLPKTFTITVNPSPNVTFSSGNQTICSGESTTLVTLNSTTTGVTFEWSAVFPIGITVMDIIGTGTIPVQTLENTTNLPLVVTYIAKALLADGAGCTGAESVYTITVNPKPSVTEKFATTICSGSTFTVSPLNGNGNIVPPGTTYTWSTPTIVPAGALTGATVESSPHTTVRQQLTNTTSANASATYTVTPSSNGCPGPPFEVNVIIKPTPTVIPVDNITLCNKEQRVPIVFTGGVTGTAYNWVSDNTNIGIAGSGSGSIPAFTAINVGTAPKIATITVTPVADGCIGLSISFTITVYPLLPVSVLISSDVNNICPGTAVTYTAIPTNGGLNPTYQWKVNGIDSGTDGASYAYAPVDGDKIESKLISNAVCPSGNPAQSNVISMVVFSSLPAGVTIETSANNICPGESSTFTATAFNGGSNPVFQWFVNGARVGTNQAVYSYDPVDGDIVSCQLLSSNTCSSNGAAASTPVKMFVSPPALQPSFEIEQLNDCAPIKVLLKNNSLPGGLAYIWDFGDGTADTTATPIDISHTFENFTAAPIEFTVSLKIVTRFTHCFNILTKKIIVRPELFAGSPVNYMGCSPFVQRFENAYAGAKSYRWIDSRKKLLSDKFQPTLTFTTTKGVDSTHIVYLIAESFFGCYDTIVNTIKVSPALAMPSFTYSGKADCRSVTYTFKNTSPEGAKVFVWDFNDGTINKTYHANELVTHTFMNGLDVAVPFNVSLTSSSGNSCSLSITQKIMVDPEYIAGFPVTFQGCSPVVRKFMNAYDGSKSYQWKSSDWELLSNEISPTFTFNALPGRDSTHLVYLISKSLNGCIDTVINKVIVRAADKAAFSAIPSEGCAPLLVQFTNASSPKTNGYQWDFGDGSDYSIVESPRHIFIDADGLDSKYKVSLVAFNQYGCADTAFHEIHLLPTPQVDFVAQPIVQTYPERTVKLTNLTPTGNWTYSWNLGDQKPLVAGLLSDYIYDLPGEYVISLTAKGSQCENTKRVKVTINPGTPLASFEPDTSGCAPLRVNFRNNSQNGSRYQWDFGNGTQSVDFSPSTTYFDEGAFTVKLKVFNQFGVMSETDRKIVVHPVPKALFKPLPYRVRIPAQAVTFFNSSENANKFLWDFGDGGSSFEFQPSHQYTLTGLFNVRLTITSGEGCKDTFLLPDAVDAFSDGLKVPNAFMPNKEGPNDGYYEAGDPRNHIFYPSVAVGDLIDYELMIYNRWGNLLFVTKEAERGWDGYYNGILCPQDVYIWKIRCKFKSGSIVTKTGDVTLIQ